MSNQFNLEIVFPLPLEYNKIMIDLNNTLFSKINSLSEKGLGVSEISTQLSISENLVKSALNSPLYKLRHSNDINK